MTFDSALPQRDAPPDQPGLTVSFDPAATLERNYGLICRLVGHIARRNGLDGAEAEELTSWSIERLVDNDYAVLRKYDARGPLKGFLCTVLERASIDYRNIFWGRWRPSARATDLGAVAVELERLVYRDRLPFREAVLRLRHRGFDAREADLRHILQQLPMRWGTHTVELAVASEVADNRSPDRALALSEIEALTGVLTEVLQQLPPEDSIVLRLHYWERLSVADVARRLHLKEKPMYRRLENLRGRLRVALEQRGIASGRISDLLDSESKE